jgi:hypothetical protein
MAEVANEVDMKKMVDDVIKKLSTQIEKQLDDILKP